MDVPSTQSRPAEDAPPTAKGAASAPASELKTTLSEKSANAPSRRRPWKRLFLIALALGFVFLPQIIAATSLRNWVVGVVRPELPEGVTVRSATFAWWEPLMLAGVEIPDDDGRPMLSVEHLTTDRTLFDILILRNKPEPHRHRIAETVTPRVGCGDESRAHPAAIAGTAAEHAESGRGEYHRRSRRPAADG